MATQERRGYQRFKLVQPVTHAKFSLSADVTLKSASTSSKDISAGGILFFSQQSYQVNDVLRLDIVLPGWQKHRIEFKKFGQSPLEPVVVLAQVVRVEAAQGGYEVAVKFVGIDEDHQQALKKFLTTLSI